MSMVKNEDFKITKGKDKLSLYKKNNREVENYFSVLKNEAEFKPLKIKSRL